MCWDKAENKHKEKKKEAKYLLWDFKKEVGITSYDKIHLICQGNAIPFWCLAK